MAVNMIGASPRFEGVLNEIAVVARADCAVLLEGETGTGKELAARAIHEASSRRHRPFVAVNCAAIPVTLLESELFGHERGAFTGAVASTRGRLQAADRGTFFLDEVGDLPIEVQPKLLRVLQHQQFERLGTSGLPVSVDVRVVAATNQDLWTMVQTKRFRADLYYRLNVFPIVLPPLRDRREDIPDLVQYFVQTFSERHGKPIRRVSDEMLDTLKGQPWPGNVRELQNVIERAVILADDGVLRVPGSLSSVRLTEPSIRTLAEAERAHILKTLRETNWVVGGWNGAAARLGLPRTTLIAKMQRLGISKVA